jgi:membrane protein DedA with SNARE-associated domain
MEQKGGNTMVHWVIDAFNHHGYLVLFLSLLLELMALPLPGELLMGSAGYMVFQGKLGYWAIIVVGSSGVAIGMTISYVLGYLLGIPFVQKYGKYVHLGPDKLDRTSKWFEAYGNKLLTIAYFIPGVRHFTGYFAGIVRIPFRSFALYAYPGALLWVGTFVTIGKLLGPQWEKFHSVISKYMLVGGIGLSLLVAAIFLLNKYRNEIVRTFNRLLNESFQVFRSLGRVKLIVTLVAAAFLGFSLLTIGLIQDYLANESDQFNEIVTLIMASLQHEISFHWVEPASVFVSIPAVVIIVTMILIWIIAKGKDRMLEISFLAFTLVGGELWGELLTSVFHRISRPSYESNAAWTDIGFPSEPTLTAVVIYGYAAFLLFRHVNLLSLKSAIIPGYGAILIWVGLNDLLIDKQIPSSIAAGFSFGGVWVSLQIVLLEVFRILRRTRQ